MFFVVMRVRSQYCVLFDISEAKNTHVQTFAAASGATSSNLNAYIGILVCRNIQNTKHIDIVSFTWFLCVAPSAPSHINWPKCDNLNDLNGIS